MRNSALVTRTRPSFEISCKVGRGTEKDALTPPQRHVDGYIAVQARVAGSIDLTHASRSDRRHISYGPSRVAMARDI
jgi:hypothetical protein